MTTPTSDDRRPAAGRHDDGLPPVRPGHYRGDSYRPEQSIGYLMRQVVDLMGRSLDARMAQHGLTDAQWKPLLALAYCEGASASQMARKIACDNGATTRLIDRLEDKGLVRRERSESDRRAIHLHLTDDGRRAAQVVPYVIADVLNGFLADLTESEIEQLGSLLQRVLERGRLEVPCQPDSERT